VVRRSDIREKGKECREGELNADCESFSSDLTNFTILERAMCCEREKRRETETETEREREKSRMNKRKLRTKEGREKWVIGPHP